MKISEQNKILDAHYQREIKAKEEKIKEIKEAYNQEIARIKDTSENAIRENRNQEREKISNELKEEKQKWEGVRNKWKEKDAIYDGQIKEEELNHEKEITLNRFRHGKQMEEDQNLFENEINALNQRKSKKIHEIQEDADAKIYQEEIKSRNNIQALRKENERLENLAINSYANFSSAQQREINKNIAEKEREHRAIMRNITTENSRQIHEKERINEENLKLQEETNQNKIRQVDADTKKRINQIQKESENTIGNLSLKTQKEINNLKKNESRDKYLISERSKDPFYSMTLLQPRITENEKEYLIKLSVPEHEKDSVIIGADGRTLKISQNRKFADKTFDENGTMNKSSRSETITQSIKLDNLVNARKITHSFENDELIFKIPKA